MLFDAFEPVGPMNRRKLRMLRQLENGYEPNFHPNVQIPIMAKHFQQSISDRPPIKKLHYKNPNTAHEAMLSDAMNLTRPVMNHQVCLELLKNSDRL